MRNTKEDVRMLFLTHQLMPYQESETKKILRMIVVILRVPGLDVIKLSYFPGQVTFKFYLPNEKEKSVKLSHLSATKS